MFIKLESATRQLKAAKAELDAARSHWEEHRAGKQRLEKAHRAYQTAHSIWASFV